MKKKFLITEIRKKNTKFLIYFFLKQVRKSFKKFCETKKGLVIMVSVLKFSNLFQIKFILSFLDLFVPKLLHLNIGPFFVYKLIKHLPQKEKKILLKKLMDFFIKSLFSRYYIRIFDLIYQCFLDRKGKEILKIFFIIREELNFFYKKNSCIPCLEIFRLINSGFSKKIKKKLNEISLGFLQFLLYKKFLLPWVLFQEFLLAWLEILPKKLFYIIRNLNPVFLIFLNNSFSGLFLISKTIKRYTAIEMVKLTNYLVTFLKEFLSHKYGHIFLLLTLVKKNPKKAILIKEILSNLKIKSKFNVIFCLFLFKPFSRVFIKKKIYRILKRKKKLNKKISIQKKNFLNFNQIRDFIEKIERVLEQRKILDSFFGILLKFFMNFTYFKKKIFSNFNSLILIQSFKLTIERMLNQPISCKFLKCLVPKRLKKKKGHGIIVLLFCSLLFSIPAFSEKTKQYLFLKFKKEFFANGKNGNFQKIKKKWEIFIKNPISFNLYSIMLTKKRIQNKKNY